MATFDVKSAIAEGYTKREIADYLSKENNFDAESARKEGYSDDHIIGELTGKPYSAMQTEGPTDKNVEIPELFQLIGQGAGAAYGIGEAALQGYRGNIVRRIASEINKEIENQKKVDLIKNKSTSVTSAAPETYHTPHGLGEGAMKNVEHNIGQKIGNPLHAKLLKDDPVLKNYTLRGNSLIFTPTGADIGNTTAAPGSNVTPETTTPLTAKQRAAAMLSKPAAQRGLSATSLAGRIVTPAYGLGQTGYGLAEFTNRMQEGTTPREKAAAIANLGASVSGFGSAAKNPKIKYPSAAISGGLNWLADLIAGEEKEPEQKATGGLINGYAKGKIIKSGLESAVGKPPRAASKIKDQATPLWEKFGYDPKKISEQYPEVLPPVEKIDPKKGTTYLGKNLSQEALAVQKARQAAQKEIEAGNYTPFFDITKRSYVDPANYPMLDKTIELKMPKKAETLAKHRAIAQSPEATARLEAAYEAGAGSPKAHGFYMMKQLEDEYIKELGPELGRTAFRRDFAEPMAATTGGQTPTANLMMTAMHNYFANKGLPIPSKGYDLPFPVGGNKLQSNIDMSQKLFNTGTLSAADSPKRYNFASNFMGHTDRPTIDEQMMRLFNPKGEGAPDWYGVNEEAVNLLANKRNVLPVNYQEVAWAAAKGYPGQPMIEDFNQMLYRTSRITGQPQEEVLKGFIRRNKPMYGITGLGALGAQEDGGVNNPD